MSGQAKRSRVRAEIRHREQVARLIAVGQIGPGFSQRWYADQAKEVLGGATFDVAIARAHAEKLITEGQRAVEMWAVFVDWTREQGRGPEVCRCPPVTPPPPATDTGTLTVLAAEVGAALLPTVKPIMIELSDPKPCLRCGGRGGPRGGWPGNLAVEWGRGPGRVKCGACNGSGEVDEYDLMEVDGIDQPVTWRISCRSCKGIGTVEGPRPQPGDAMFRAGRRLLAVLEGQPSECQECGGGANSDYWNGYEWRVCETCRGTGHNLAGVLPPIEWSASVYRRVSDSAGYSTNDRRSWCSDLVDAGLMPPRGDLMFFTRSYPRGEHRAHESEDMVLAIQRCTNLDGVIAGDSSSLWCPLSTLRGDGDDFRKHLSRRPRWLRGELVSKRRRQPGFTFTTVLPSRIQRTQVDRRRGS